MRKNRLKKMNMNSVDFVRNGANQEADIMLYKSADHQEDEIPQGLWKSIQDAVSSWWNGGGEEETRSQEFEITKSSYMDAIDYSMQSIMEDETLDSVKKSEMAEQSIDEFCEAMKAAIREAVGAPQSLEKGLDEETLDGIEKNGAEPGNGGQNVAVTKKEGDVTMKNKVRIDKSLFSEEERQQYEALIAKATVEEDPELEKEFPPKKKPAAYEEEPEMHPEVKKALEEIEGMKKSFEMSSLHEIAKKYSVLGKNEDELADTLYEMKKSSPASYDAYVKLLDEQVSMVEKSGMFEEIGKSGHGRSIAGGDTVGKINAIASEIQKADPTLNRFEAVQKAWDQNPDLLADYERKLNGGK